MQPFKGKTRLKLELEPEQGNMEDLEFLKAVITAVQAVSMSFGRAVPQVEFARQNRRGLLTKQVYLPDSEQAARAMLEKVPDRPRKNVQAKTSRKGETIVQRQMRLRQETIDAMAKAGYHPPKAADLLGIGHSTIYERLRMIGYATPKAQKLRANRAGKATPVQRKGRSDNKPRSP